MFRDYVSKKLTKITREKERKRKVMKVLKDWFPSPGRTSWVAEVRFSLFWQFNNFIGPSAISSGPQ